VAVIAVTRHQLLDPAASLGGLLTRSAITRQESAAGSMRQALVEQLAQHSQGIGDRVDVGARGMRGDDQGAGASGTAREQG
jgi:hypothetical protein